MDFMSMDRNGSNSKRCSVHLRSELLKNVKLVLNFLFGHYEHYCHFKHFILGIVSKLRIASIQSEKASMKAGGRSFILWSSVV